MRRTINDDSKINLISLLIELGNPSHGLNNLFGFPPNGLYDHFFTGKEVRNRMSMSLIIILIDFGASLEIEEAIDLHQNLMKFCGLYAAENADKVSAADGTDWPLVLEKEWAYKLVDVFHNLRNATTSPNHALRYLLSHFNKVS